MTALAPHISAFLREHLPRERKASQHTCEAYAYSFQLLVCFAADRLGKRPSLIEIEQLDAPLILAFLEHIEGERGNTARTRNARLAAINSFFRFLEYRLPSCLDQSRRIHAIPMKKTDEALKRLFGDDGKTMLRRVLGKDADSFWKNYELCRDWRNQIAHRGRRIFYESVPAELQLQADREREAMLWSSLYFVPTCWVVFSKLWNEYIHKPMLARMKAGG